MRTKKILAPQVRARNRKFDGYKVVLCVSALFLSVALLSCKGPAEQAAEGLVKEMDMKAQQTVRDMMDASQVDPNMGDWQGTLKSGDGTESPLVAQVIALGKRKYRANVLTEFDKRIEPMVVLEGERTGIGIGFAGPVKNSTKWQGVIESGKFTGSLRGSRLGRFVMRKALRSSPTLGARPPAGTLVLFDGENYDRWEHPKKPGPVQWKLVNGAMEVRPGTGSIITKIKFNDFKLHLEFRTPFTPEARGQGRGNSGLYLQGRYEVQILDSYGLKGRDNECGGIYEVAAPEVNMCAPPMQWQTYDITFYAPRFDSSGAKTKNARMTVLHNGVKIHDDRDVPGPTRASLDSNVTEPGGIYLQGHGNAVQYRNIWLLELP